MIVVQISVKVQQVRREHVAVLADPLAPTTQLGSEAPQRRIHGDHRNPRREFFFLSRIHFVHHVQNNGIPEFPAIRVLVEQKLLRRRRNALLGSFSERESVVFPRENGDGDGIGGAEVPVEIVVFDEAVGEEKAAIVAAAVGIHDLRALAEIEEGGDDEGLFFVVVFPGGLARTRVIEHVGEENEDSVVERVEVGAEVAARVERRESSDLPMRRRTRRY